MRASICALMLAIAALTMGCEQSALPTIRMPIGKKTFTLEVAATDATQEHGLMERDSMPDDHGMIFVFADEQPRAFWMKNTRFALDILFVDAGGKVVSIHRMKPYDQNTTSSAGPAKYAIELNAGAAKEAAVAAGDKLTIPPEAKEPKDAKSGK